MSTTHVSILHYPQNKDASIQMTPDLRDQIHRGVAILKKGGVVAFPTDTLYGLGAHAFRPEAVQRIFAIKGRTRGAGLPLLLADVDDLSAYVIRVPDLAWALARRFLPGALTLVLWRGPRVSPIITGGSDTVALRVPDHPVPRTLARELGAPITGTSANLSGRPGLSTAQEVRQELGARVDLIIDGGPSAGGAASTVVDLTGEHPRILREGAISRREIAEVCGHRVLV